MPSLDKILEDTLLMVGAKTAPAGALTEFEPGIGSFTPRPSPQLGGPVTQPIWVWDYTGVREVNQEMPMNRVEDLEVWSRTVAAMHGGNSDLGWMTVARPIVWGPITVALPHENVVLPLTQKYFVKGFMLASGANPGAAAPSGGNTWWPLPADLDQSFASVFLYDLTSRQQFQPPATVPSSHYDLDVFMPDANVDQGALPLGATGQGASLASRHVICVVLSLVCMRERADFEPGSVVGMGRFYPHFMIMSNQRLNGNAEVNATITVTRPDKSGYHGTYMNPGGLPRIMSHPDMDPEILPLLTAEPNLARGVDPINVVLLPYWDLVFDYFLPIDYRGGATGPLPINQTTQVVDRALTGRRRAKRILQHLDYSKLNNLASVAIAGTPILPPPWPAVGAKAAQIAMSRPSLQSVMFGNPLTKLIQLGAITAADFLPRVKKDLIKLPGQGTFDNVHIAPRMIAHNIIGTPEISDPKWVSSLDTLDAIRMAPFCEHDCMHTHWRWGAAFKNHPFARNQLPLGGFDTSADPRFTGTGKPYQVVGNPMVPLNQNIDIAFGQNAQLRYHAQIVNAAPGVWQPVYHHGSAYALGFSASGTVAHGLTEAVVAGSAEDSELYWNLRYQATVDGALERVVLDPADLYRAMMANNTVRLHLKVFEEPPLVRIETMLANTKALFDLHGIDVIETSRETFTTTGTEYSRFQTLAIDGYVPTDDQTNLFNFRGDAEPDELVIYFVRTLVPTQTGCANHPPDKPGAIVCASMANEWTLAHQIGHVLGLDHVEDINRLMTKHSTKSLEDAVPELLSDEVATMMDSPLNTA